MLRTILVILLFQNSICLSQLNKTLEQEVNDSLFNQGQMRYFTVGGHTDIINTTFGVQVSNGIDEKPLLHFEDLTYNFLYKLAGQTDFNQNYSYEVMLGWNNPSKRAHSIIVNLLAVEYFQRQIEEELLFQKKLNLIGGFYIKQLPFSVIAKAGMNQINSFNALGGEIGIRKMFKGIYIESLIGYYSDFYTFSVITQCNFYKKVLYGRLVFEQIDNFNSLTIGIHYTFSRFK